MKYNFKDKIINIPDAEIQANMNAIDDAQTGGLSKYTRAADSAEAKIQ